MSVTEIRANVKLQGGGNRRLAAVLFADVAGYSRLVDHDEAGALSLLTEQRAIMDAHIVRCGGRIANTAGDSVLAEFPSAANAVRCAISAQVEMFAMSAGLPADRRVTFRMGLHVGDVVEQGRDLLGDTINLAARLQASAEPGGIVVSAAVREQVRKTLPARFSSLGELSLKNIAEPVSAYAVVLFDDAVKTREPDRPRPGAAQVKPDHGLRLVGGRGTRNEALEAAYVDHWVGCFRGMRNRDLITMVSFNISASEAGLRCEFTEGRFWGAGPAFAASLRLQCFWEMAPAYDRVCAMIFNGAFGREIGYMSGLVLSPASDPIATPAASPILLFRTASGAEYAAAGGVDAMRARLSVINAERLGRSKDVRQAWADILPAPLIELLLPTVGAPRADGETDLVLRMPADRVHATFDQCGKKIDRVAPRLRKVLGY